MNTHTHTCTHAHTQIHTCTPAHRPTHMRVHTPSYTMKAFKIYMVRTHYADALFIPFHTIYKGNGKSMLATRELGELLAKNLAFENATELFKETLWTLSVAADFNGMFMCGCVSVWMCECLSCLCMLLCTHTHACPHARIHTRACTQKHTTHTSIKPLLSLFLRTQLLSYFFVSLIIFSTSFQKMYKTRRGTPVAS